MAKWIPPGKITIKGRTDITAWLKLNKLPKWIDIEKTNNKDNIEFDITCITEDKDFIKLDLIFIKNPDNEWFESFDGYIAHRIKTNPNQREICHTGYVKHEFTLEDEKTKEEVVYYIQTYDILPDNNDYLFASDVWFAHNDNMSNYDYLERKWYKTEEEAIKGHEDLKKKWFEKEPEK